MAAELLDLDEGGVAELARQAVRYSFLDAADKTTVVAEIDEYLQTFARRAPATNSSIAQDHR
ncbi:hypothetical protein GCM10029963_76290 [Micromonospora andamanensis]|nr:hypothetical protein Vwe01_58680 [Micromonospora andamanensis]